MKRIISLLKREKGTAEVKAAKKQFFKVKLWYGTEKAFLNVEVSDTLDDLITRVSTVLGWPRSTIRLFHEYLDMELIGESLTLSQCCIAKGSLIRLEFDDSSDDSQE